MEFTRRDICAMGAGTAATLALAGGLPAFAATDDVQKAMDEFTGGKTPTEGGVELTAPEIAENGNTVPVEVASEGAKRITVLAVGNPRPEVVTFVFGPLAGAHAASTRIRLAETQDLVAIAEMPDGSFRKATRQVKVTIGGCGG